MFLVIWEFHVKPEFEERFLKVYGPAGDWAQLFARDPNFEKTMLLADPARSHIFLTLDFWKNQTAYHDFKEKFRQPYQSLDQQCEDMTASEVCLGSFDGGPTK